MKFYIARDIIPKKINEGKWYMNKKLIITMIAIACAVSIIIAIILSVTLKKNDNTTKNPNTTEEKTHLTIYSIIVWNLMAMTLATYQNL